MLLVLPLLLLPPAPLPPLILAAVRVGHLGGALGLLLGLSSLLLLLLGLAASLSIRQEDA